MRNILIFVLPVVLSVIVSISTIAFLDHMWRDNSGVLSVESTPVPTPLAKYNLRSLEDANFPSEPIEITEVADERDESTTYIFKHSFDPTGQNNSNNNKTVTGTINIPNDNQKYPVVVLIRGYVDKEIYSPGLGTKNVGIFMSENGFLTIAPDFLGYGGSDTESFDIFEARFQTYTTTLSVLNSLDRLENWDGENIFIWAHSNGGQIALTTLAITGDKIPTSLWAPVSKSFPYSILYFSDELIDKGKYIRRELAGFEELYDIDEFTFTNYLDQINAPIQIHQGRLDDAVPYEWSVEFSNLLEEQDIENSLFIYSTADHNMRPNWDLAVERDLEFFIDNMH